MKRSVTLQLEVEDGEDVLLVAMVSAGLTLSVARKADKAEFGAIVGQAAQNDRPVTVTYGERV